MSQVWGYYVAGVEKFGARGDFVTAPELGSLFGRCVAEQCRQILSDYTDCEVIEFGGGSGRAAATILASLSELGCLPERYTIIELSPELRERQQQTIRELSPRFLERVVWADRPPHKPINGCVLANEVIDALPARYFQVGEGEVLEFWVDVASDEGFCWRMRPAEDSISDMLRDSPGFEYCASIPGIPIRNNSRYPGLGARSRNINSQWRGASI